MTRKKRRNRRSVRSHLLQCYRATAIKKHPYIRFEDRVRLIGNQMKKDCVRFEDLDEAYIHSFLERVNSPLEHIFYQETFALIHYGNILRAKRFNARKIHQIFPKQKNDFKQVEKIIRLLDGSPAALKQYRDLKLFTLMLIKELHDCGIHIQFYEAHSTNSFYLKLDYGVLRSVRISDHYGEATLPYMYNVLTEQEEVETKERQRFYPFNHTSMHDLVETVLIHRNHLMNKYNYSTLLKNEKATDRKDNRFWKRAITFLP